MEWQKTPARGDSWCIADRTIFVWLLLVLPLPLMLLYGNMDKIIKSFFFRTAFYLCWLLFRLDIERQTGAPKKTNEKSISGTRKRTGIDWISVRGMVYCEHEFAELKIVRTANVDKLSLFRIFVGIFGVIRLCHRRVSKVHSWFEFA